MNRRAPVTGAQRRRYESRTPERDPLKASIHAIERAVAETGGRGMGIEWDGPGIVVVMARTPAGGMVGGRVTVADHESTPIAILYAGANCLRALIEAKAQA